jgi:ABC-2 type transport system ATP-binding protein
VTRPRLLALALTLAAATALPSCSSDSSASTRGDQGPARTSGHPCDRKATTAKPRVAPVAGTPSDRTLTSFDGTKIRLHWFPVAGASKAEPAPTVLMGPGWSLPGDTSTDGAPLFGALSIRSLWAHGYNVLTWDPRGFGASGGVATVDHAGHEGRDVQLMLDYVAAQPQAQLDDAGDPRVGMVGFSYGGGIQLTVGAMDCRVDALVPGIAWHSLETSLYKADTVKAGWANVLTATVPKDRLDPHIVSATESGLHGGVLSAEDRQWFVDRGPGDSVGKITAPTLFIGGTVDTLFTLDEDIANYRLLRQAGVPTAMLWFCGGHGTCLTDEGDPKRVEDATFAWLDRYVKGLTATELGPRLDLVDQDGHRWTAPDYPVPTAGDLGIAAGAPLTLSLTEDSKAGPIDTRGSTDPMAGVVSAITPAEADRAAELTVRADRDGLALGAPQLTLTYRGTSPAGTAPTRVFAQLVDDRRHVVVGNQITPIPLELDGADHTATIPLEVIAQAVHRGDTLTLQLVATTPAYATPRLGGQVTFDAVALTVPMAKGITEG